MFTLKYRPDFILSYSLLPHGILGFLISKILKIKFVYGEIDLNSQNYCKNKFLQLIIKWIFKNTDIINVPGTISREYWIEKGLEEKKINILHSSINTDKDFYNTKSNKIYDLIYIGALEKRKKLDLIIESIYEVKKRDKFIKFIIIGEGSERNLLTLLINKLNLNENVILIGKSDRILDYLNKSKVFILLSENEGLPCALMEAMACELIVISNKVSDIPDVVVNNITGYLLKELNVETVAKAIYNALNDNNSRLGENARNIIIDKYSYAYSQKKWKNILDSL